MTNINRRPVGQIDKAAGWYGEDEGPLPSETPNISQTTATPVDPNPANQVTRAINTPFYNNSEDLTVPPTNSSGNVTLPNQVHEVDENATRVTPAAYVPPTAGNYAPKAGYRGRAPAKQLSCRCRQTGGKSSFQTQPAGQEQRLAFIFRLFAAFIDWCSIYRNIHPGSGCIFLYLPVFFNRRSTSKCK